MDLFIVWILETSNPNHLKQLKLPIIAGSLKEISVMKAAPRFFNDIIILVLIVYTEVIS